MKITTAEYNDLISFAKRYVHAKKEVFVLPDYSERGQVIKRQIDITAIDVIHDLLIDNPEATFRELKAQICKSALQIFYATKKAADPGISFRSNLKVTKYRRLKRYEDPNYTKIESAKHFIRHKKKMQDIEYAKKYNQRNRLQQRMWYLNMKKDPVEYEKYKAYCRKKTNNLNQKKRMSNENTQRRNTQH